MSVWAQGFAKRSESAFRRDQLRVLIHHVYGSFRFEDLRVPAAPPASRMAIRRPGPRFQQRGRRRSADGRALTRSTTRRDGIM
jgi:hypothetical protein